MQEWGAAFIRMGFVLWVGNSINWVGFARAETGQRSGRAASCEGWLSGVEEPRDSTDRWLAAIDYLGTRPDLLSPLDYMSWLKDLSQKKVANPFQSPLQGTEILLWSRNLEIMMKAQKLGFSKIARYAARKIKLSQGASKDRAAVETETENPALRPRFFDSGLRVGDSGLERPPRIGFISDWRDYPIEVMDTPVTQWMWLQLIGDNPSRFTDGGSFVLLDGHSVPLRSDNPVENLRLFDVWKLLLYLNHPNTPVEEIQRVIPDHQRGNLYILPNPLFYRQIFSLARLDSLTIESDLDGLENFAWYRENSGGQTQPVRTLSPHFINEEPVYDLIGNVRECAVESWFDPPTSVTVTLHGGDCIYAKSHFLKWAVQVTSSRDVPLDNLEPKVEGIRLLRVRVPPHKVEFREWDEETE